MNAFPLGPLAGELYDNGRKLVLLRPFAFVDGAERVDVPALATSDFNSTPRIVWSVFPPWRYPEAGVVHDWLYRHPGDRTREACDRIHRRVLEVTGASWVLRQTAYRALRWFGGRAWNGYRRAQ